MRRSPLSAPLDKNGSRGSLPPIWGVDVRMGGERDFVSVDGGGSGSRLAGGKGRDLPGHFGSPGTIDGPAGNDRLSGGNGDDLLIGGKGYDLANGRAGFDRCSNNTEAHTHCEV